MSRNEFYSKLSNYDAIHRIINFLDFSMSVRVNCSSNLLYKYDGSSNRYSHNINIYKNSQTQNVLKAKINECKYFFDCFIMDRMPFYNCITILCIFFIYKVACYCMGFALYSWF